jgi:cysteine desulfurase
MLRGGGQERGLRSGTTNTPALAGLAVAASEIDLVAMTDIRRRRDKFEEKLMNVFSDVVIHSRDTHRLPNTSAFSFNGVVGEELVQILAADGIIVGTGSACSSGAGHPSKTILAMGVPYALAEGSIRVSISASTPSSFAEILIDSMSKNIRR